ncbi:MAG: hypothetical protein KDE03_07630 [Rhodobacteraceae bacterium]|nr:hypothetical protein [Paracoccaceae bacterium]
MSGGATILEKVHFAIEHLLDTPDGWRPLVREMAARWPDDSASEIVYALVKAASEIESMFGEGSPARSGAEKGWRLAALLGLDFYAMEELGLPRAKAAHLEGYWKIDPYFREL